MAKPLYKVGETVKLVDDGVVWPRIWCGKTGEVTSISLDADRKTWMYSIDIHNMPYSVTGGEYALLRPDEEIPL